MPILLKVFLRTLKVLPYKCCYNNIIVPNDFPVWHLETTSGEINAGELPEVTATAGSSGGMLARPTI